MRNIIIILLAFVIICSCGRMINKIVVKGEIENGNGKYIYLQELTVKNEGKMDSILLDKSGSFKFKREAAQPSFYALTIKNEKPVSLILLPGEQAKVTGVADSLFKTYQVEGSGESELALEITRRLDLTLKSVDSLNMVYQQYQGNPNFDNIRTAIAAKYNSILEDQHKFSVNFIENHPNSLASLMTLYQQIDKKTFILYKEEDFKYYQQTDSILFKKYPKAPFALSLHGNVTEMKEDRQVIQLRRMLSAVGAKAPEITLISTKGDTNRLSSYKGKYVLLNFWASWSQPSRKENLNLVSLYNKYKWKGFDIFQVSLDKSKDDWIRAIHEDGLWWKHGSDLKYWQSPVVSLYSFESIPMNILIDKDGIIIARDIRGVDLKNKLTEIFDKQPENTAAR